MIVKPRVKIIWEAEWGWDVCERNRSAVGTISLSTLLILINPYPTNMCKYASMEICKYANRHICKYAIMQVGKYAIMQ